MNTPIELELKYAITAEQVTDFLALPYLQSIAHSANDLYSIYYDTIDFELFKKDYVLRVRKKGDSYIQTVKRSGHVVNGLHERPEWEWVLSNKQINLNYFPEVDMLKGLALKPIFITEFERLTWLITQKGTRFELCLDQGSVYIPNSKSTTPISEIELELISGSADTLSNFGSMLQAQLGLKTENVSKAERGFKLYN